MLSRVTAYLRRSYLRTHHHCIAMYTQPTLKIVRDVARRAKGQEKHKPVTDCVGHQHTEWPDSRQYSDNSRFQVEMQQGRHGSKLDTTPTALLQEVISIKIRASALRRSGNYNMEEKEKLQPVEALQQDAQDQAELDTSSAQLT